MGAHGGFPALSRLVLVRHAQASLSSDPARAFDDYDRLSELGRKQAEALAEELVAGAVAFDRVLCGPAARHRETLDLVAAVYAHHARPWPSPEIDADLGEHLGARVVARALEQPQHHAELALPSTEGSDPTRAYLATFRAVTRRWARGELPPELEVEEGWTSFRARVERCVRRILDAAGKGETIGVFTSGGPIGSTVAWALGLSDERAIELAWVVQNATLTEILFDGRRVSLASFNVQPRLGRREMHTHV